MKITAPSTADLKIDFRKKEIYYGSSYNDATHLIAPFDVLCVPAGVTVEFQETDDVFRARQFPVGTFSKVIEEGDIAYQENGGAGDSSGAGDGAGSGAGDGAGSGAE
jgi:hypothetical protein